MKKTLTVIALLGVLCGILYFWKQSTSPVVSPTIPEAVPTATPVIPTASPTASPGIPTPTPTVIPSTPTPTPTVKADTPTPSPSASPVPPQVTPTPDPVMQEMIPKISQLYKGMNSFSYTSSRTVSIQSPVFVDDTTTQLQVWMQRPNLLRIKNEEGVKTLEIISDGTQVFFYVPSLNAYLVYPAPPTLAELVLRYVCRPIPQVGDGPFDYFHMMENPSAALTKGASRVELMGVDNLEGTECNHLRIHRSPAWIDVWFQKGDQPLLRKIVPDPSPYEANLAKQVRDAKVDLHMVYGSWQVNPVIPPETFRFTPPEGAELKASAEELYRPKDPNELTGKEAPTFRIPLLAGGEFNLADHKGKDVIILDFWGTRCPPCVMSLPVLSGIANEYKDKGVVFLAVNQGESPQIIKAFMEMGKLSFPVGLDDTGEASMKYYVRRIPQSVIIGKDGKVANVHIGFARNMKDTLREELNTLLGLAPPPSSGSAPQASTNVPGNKQAVAPAVAPAPTATPLPVPPR